MLRILGIPFAMATQHPDSASRTITAREEVNEAVLDLTPLEDGGFGCDEKMVDYEGKLTPYHQPEWIVEALAGTGLVPGEDYLITPRIPAERAEDPARQVIIIWSCLVANRKSFEVGGQAVKFMVLPMSSTSRDLILVHQRISKLSAFAREEIGLRLEEPIRLVPLIEDVSKLIHVDKLLAGFHAAVVKTEGLVYDYYRVFLGKSDAALAYGHLASSIALRVSLSRLARWAYNEGVRVYPIIGVGKPPFRGHLAPWSVDSFVEQYAGYYTVTIQSALRFDTPRRSYEETIVKLRENVGREIKCFEPEEETLLIEAARKAAAEYLKIIALIADRIGEVASFIPTRRDRLPPEKYGRDLSSSLVFAAEQSLARSLDRKTLPLPRAIRFTAALYTMGLPPALLGLGQALARIEKELGDRALDLLLKNLPLLRHDLRFELHWFSREVARSYVGPKLTARFEEGVKTALEIIGEEAVEAEEEYVRLLLKARQAILSGEREEAVRAITEAAVKRGFLG